MTQPASSTQQPRIVALGAFTVLGMRIQTSPMGPDIQQLWQRFAPRIGEVQVPVEPGVSYGVMDNFDPQSQRFDYMAGVSVSRTEDQPQGMVAWPIPANTYAVFTTPLSRLGDAFRHIFGQWLPQAPYQKLDAPYFERYGQDFDPANPESPVEIFLPIQAKTA